MVVQWKSEHLHMANVTLSKCGNSILHPSKLFFFQNSILSWKKIKKLCVFTKRNDNWQEKMQGNFLYNTTLEIHSLSEKKERKKETHALIKV